MSTNPSQEWDSSVFSPFCLLNVLENVCSHEAIQNYFSDIMKGTNTSFIWVLKPLARCSFRLTSPPCARHVLSSWNPQLGLSKDTTKLAKSRIKVFVKQDVSSGPLWPTQSRWNYCNAAPLKYLVLKFKKSNVTSVKRLRFFVLFCNRYLFTLLDLLIWKYGILIIIYTLSLITCRTWVKT